MKRSLLIIAMMLLLVATPSTLSVFAQQQSITVSTDSQDYESGDTIIISGDVGIVKANQAILIQVWNPNGVLYRADLVNDISSDGSYTYDLKVGGKIGISGMYRVVATYDQRQGETTFAFTATEAVTNVTIDGKQYPIRVRGGGGLPSWFRGVSAEPDTKSLVIDLDTTQAEVLEIELDNSLIDTESECFIVHIDGQEVEAQCTPVDQDTTLLTVSIPAGADELKITGSFLVPEFSMIAIILVLSLAAIVIASRYSKFGNLHRNI